MMTKSSLSFSAILLFSAGVCDTKVNAYSSRETTTPNDQTTAWHKRESSAKHLNINKMAFGRVLVSKSQYGKISASSNSEVIDPPQVKAQISHLKKKIIKNSEGGMRIEGILQKLKHERIDLNKPATVPTIPSKSSAFKQYTRPKSSVSDRHLVTISSKSSASKTPP
uniref:AlNc14C254G9689 protein n=1 Tax=Albugo laibachii Nc14 TaxID=890382 RepID=F0WTL0_9STRA|nr:AlNc14C254G9689 [Albugo laibachii Nc14]|eukprot:CCA24701.1 AlNc14C254G9689 [Albugo laibachii Nc14]